MQTPMSKPHYAEILPDVLIGEGSFGTVKRCITSEGQKLAVKKIETKDAGLPCLLEASIMSILDHPYINRSLFIYADEASLYITQEEAISDLYSYVHRVYKNKGNLGLDQIRNWCFQLAQAVACMHKEQLIHADIKASNVLVFPNDELKLSDFTLSVKQWSNDDKFRHQVCTSTHRPPECFMNEQWSYALDIWSLGCTFYELAYGQSLFPNQKTKTIKDRLGDRFLSCLIDFDLSGPGLSTGPYKTVTISEYIKWQLSPRFYEPEMAQFNVLLLSMLSFDQSQRPTAIEILENPFFADMRIRGWRLVSTRAVPIKSKDREKLEQDLDTVAVDTIDSKVKALSLELYSRCIGLTMTKLYIIAACFWIAHKIIKRKKPAVRRVTLHILLQAERDICQHLSYRLHQASLTSTIIDTLSSSTSSQTS